jgi:hypothetical protein
MSFNKRYFNMKMLTARYEQNPETAIDDAVGKTDGFIFGDNLSKEIISLWSEGKDDEAYSKLKEYVSGISTKIS